MTAWATGTVAVTGGVLAYHRTGGHGPALVLSHGLTDNGLCWSRLAAALEDRFDVIMLDARGHGDSSGLPVGAPHDPARDIAEAVEAFGLERPIVMGHSVGGRATAAYANAFPDRVSKVVLEDPAFVPLADPTAAEARRRRFGDEVARLRAMTEAEITALGRASHPNWDAAEFPAWTAAKQQVRPDALPAYATPWQTQIDRIAAPTLLVHGEAALGSLITPALAAEVRTLNDNIRTVEISSAGHNVRRENFPEFLTVVRAFLLDQPPA
jgi:pimeloyl-ACP methyl ester carboxylesterase